MKTFELKGVSRTADGKKGAKQLRKENMVPCVIYGVEKDAEGKPVATPFAVDADSLRKLVYTPHIYVVKLTIDDKPAVEAIIKETQFHPVKDNVLHMDLFQITEDKPIVMSVPVALTGLAEGVRAGGKLVQAVRKLKVKGLFTDIPEKLVIDVTKLELGKSIKVGELSFDNLSFVSPATAVVCTVKMTRGAAAAAAAAAK